MKIRIIYLTLTLIFGGCATSKQCKVPPSETIVENSEHIKPKDKRHQITSNKGYASMGKVVKPFDH